MSNGEDDDDDIQSASEENFYNEYRRLVQEKGAGAVDQVLDELKSIYGAPPLVARVLAEDKEYFLANLVKSRTVLHKKDAPLDQKTVELLIIAAATALRCDHCIEVHIKQAVKHGATRQEILQTIMVACAIMETSGRATAFRKYRQIFGKMEQSGD